MAVCRFPLLNQSCQGVADSLRVLAYGATMPAVNISNAAKLEKWLEVQVKLIRAWGCVSVGIDICVCILRESHLTSTRGRLMSILVVWLFLKSKESMFHAERALWNKLLVLVFETMSVD